MLVFKRLPGRPSKSASLSRSLALLVLENLLLLALVYGAIRLYTHFRHRIPGRSWDNY